MSTPQALDPDVLTDLCLTALGRPRSPDVYVACPACDALVHHAERSEHCRTCTELRDLVAGRSA